MSLTMAITNKKAKAVFSQGNFLKYPCNPLKIFEHSQSKTIYSQQKQTVQTAGEDIRSGARIRDFVYALLVSLFTLSPRSQAFDVCQGK